MKILVLDAATEACSVALQDGDDVISKFEVCPQQHSQKLLPFVDQVLAEAGVKLKQLDGIAYGQGPGSFTGVRIGVSVTQGLAFGADLPVVGVSNLAAMAQEVITKTQAERVAVAIDARMGEIYLGFYQNENGVAVLVGNESVVKPEYFALPEQWQDQAFHSAGTGWQTYGEQLNEIASATATEVELPNAEFMLPLAQQLFADGKQVAAEFAQANYVRDEVTWKKLPGR